MKEYNVRQPKYYKCFNYEHILNASKELDSIYYKPVDSSGRGVKIIGSLNVESSKNTYYIQKKNIF